MSLKTSDRTEKKTAKLTQPVPADGVSPPLNWYHQSLTGIFLLSKSTEISSHLFSDSKDDCTRGNCTPKSL